MSHVVFLIAGQAIEIETWYARGLAAQLRQVDDARVLPHGELATDVGDSRAAASAIEWSIEHGRPVDLQGKREAAALWGVLELRQREGSLPPEVDDLRRALAAEVAAD